MNLIHSLDILGAIFSFLSTVYYIKADIKAWPLGLIAVCLNGLLYFHTGIYGDMGLEVIYFISILYGWYLWKPGANNKNDLPISELTLSLACILGVIAFIGIAVLSYILIHYTNSKVPYIDAITTIFSLIAQWMICKKIIQCWFLWFFVDALYVGLYIYKGIPAHSILLIMYLVMAVVGYVNWRRLMKRKILPLPSREGNNELGVFE